MSMPRANNLAFFFPGNVFCGFEGVQHETNPIIVQKLTKLLRTVPKLSAPTQLPPYRGFPKHTYRTYHENEKVTY